MSRQHADALASLRSNTGMAERVAASVAKTGKLLLLGMGASHYANRIAEPLYRQLGSEAWASTAADQLHSPLPPALRTVIIVSQSGESGEIPELVRGLADDEHSFGMTLDASSTLGRSLPCLVGAGGSEVAFAATRSLTVTLALHAAVLSAIGGSDGGAAASLLSPPAAAVDEALHALVNKPVMVVSGQGVFRGLAETSALMITELARMPALGFELGQFRHGPLELLSPDIGVVVLRGAEENSAAMQRVAQAVSGAGSTPVIFDCSGERPLPGAVTIALPRLQGLGAVLAMLPSLQRLIIEIAARKVARVGEPVRSTKITRAA
ncbi:aminotransferase [Mesorhizobium sp. BAC0120]|uniref:SIS domain-containing protein n=1 Tax=Mesorhizobium sp. BAC0120 TaxID=3090670 RepID=UPI00298C36F7|nr:aminotransferase [Mesorhizobium sp. BAC0120]MDW6022560.1 aminotransferase [Mesorhizobium sp. BAC0120]